jgi:glutaminase
MAGGQYLGFNNSMFLSEKETAHRNYALGYYMKENKCFPDDVNLQETMDLYFQVIALLLIS